MYSKIIRKIKIKIASLPFGAKHFCPICNNNIQFFLPYRGGMSDVPPFLRSLEMIGSDVENFSCPVCASHDRERHLMLYLMASGALNKMQDKNVLHIAPEKNLRKLIHPLTNNYVMGDLHPTEKSIRKINLQKTDYPDNYFDFVIANHVLEHVENDISALNEIYRITSPRGYAILQTPYSNALHHTFCDPGIKTELARINAYGQEDHQRLYGLDLPMRIQSSGLQSLIQRHSDLLPTIDSKKFGINPEEPFFLFQKP